MSIPNCLIMGLKRHISIWFSVCSTISNKWAIWENICLLYSTTAFLPARIWQKQAPSTSLRTLALYEDFKSRMLQILLQKQCLQGKVKKCSEFNYNGIVVSDAKRPFFAFKFLSKDTQGFLVSPISLPRPAFGSVRWENIYDPNS